MASRRMLIIAALALAGLFVLAPGGFAIAQDKTDQVAAADWGAQLDALANRLAEPDLPDDALPQMRDEAESIASDARALLAERRVVADQVQAELDALGPPPAEDAAPEVERVAALRKEVTARLAEATAPVKEMEVIVSRADRLISEIAAARRARFAAKIAERAPSPLSPAVWSIAVPELGLIGQSIYQATAKTISKPDFQKKLRQSFVVLLIAVLLAVLMVWPLQRWLLHRYGRDPAVTRPSFMRALRATLVVGATTALVPTAAAAIIYVVVLNQDLLTPIGREIGHAIFLGFLLFSWTVAFLRASLSPFLPSWRVVPVPTDFAVGVRYIVIGLALAFAVDIVLSQVIVSYNARLVVTELRDYALTIVVTALLLILLLRRRIWVGVGAPGSKVLWLLIRAFLFVGLLVALVLGALGYVTLARFAVSQLVVTGGLILLFLFLHRLGREFIRQAVSTDTWIGERLRRALETDNGRAERFGFWVALAYDVILIPIAVIIGLFVWGADTADVAGLLHKAFFGFQIGNVTFSVTNLLIAIAIFLGLLIATRFVQRMWTEKVVPQTQLDTGISQSIKTALGYAGIVIAAVLAISAVGFDLSSLAIVAGALSVGIGFGLQNVVNNFVSGLIVLIERPVKVGDWVVIGDKQGYVKRIKVRATEIQTFERASVFVPNSQLISDVVTNWTYADRLGRVIIPIGVAYGSNTELVQKTLLEVGAAHPQVLREPGPTAVFRGFGDSALNFELRCFIQNVNRIIEITSDLCFAIDEAFRKHGIDIPFPQRDIHIKSGG